MGTYTGTNGNDQIGPGVISAGVIADPPGTTPGDDPDTLIGNEGDDFLEGGSGDDQLFGGEGRDVLAGGHGADTMEGGAGSDVYIVDDPGDVTIEETADASGGMDTVLASISYTLSFGLENLQLQDRSRVTDIDGTGNVLDNRLKGSGGNNVLRGNGGDDELLGSRGNDALRGNRGDDVLDGGQGGDQLKGAAGDDMLNGGRSQDRLSGGQGGDTFMFDSPRESGDAITDFGAASGNDDRIFIDVVNFGGGLDFGNLAREQFQRSVGHEARDAEVRFIFDTRDATLWFDENGDAAGGLTLVADLQADANLRANDIVLV